MIEHISIQNFAIIKDLRIDLGPGLNIITGETGAGKSIIIEAIHMALGGRADSALVRTGCKKARIQLQLTGPSQEEPLVLTREISENGRSSCRIGDEIVTLASLHQFCRDQVDVHGQYDNQTLLDPEQHIHILDTFDIFGDLTDSKAHYQQLYREFTDLQSRLSSLNRSISESLRKRDFMEFEREEIRNAALTPGEDEDIQHRLTVLQHSEKIFSAASTAYESLYASEYSASASISAALQSLRDIMDLSDTFSEIYQNVESLQFQVDEIASELAPYSSSEDFDPREIDALIDRQENIAALKRKYGESIEAILQHEAALTQELDNIENVDQRKAALVEQLRQTGMALLTVAENLSESRKKAARQLETAVNRELAELNFSNSDFQVRFTRRETGKGKVEFSPEGIDQIEFYITTNKGEAHKPIAKISSGGEISRIMLALKKILGDYSAVPTYIFDEIDTGISGNAAAVVGKKLAQIARNRQILCITHLPQIAVMGDAHYLIEKFSDEKETYTTVREMDEPMLVQEIARLSGSAGLTEAAMRNAEEMIRRAREGKMGC